jgi:hydroxymethylglutaryl-CoA lyase
MEQLERQIRLWDDAGIPVRKVFLADPMGWNIPDRVRQDLEAIKRRWPSISTFALHLHNQRGLAMTSSYVAMQTLAPEDTLMLDATLGGIGGCPYCGNGRLAGMVPTEDMIQLLEMLGVPTGVDLYRLVETVELASRIVGRPLDGHVSKAGPFPQQGHLYPTSVPAVETAEQAQHFRLGPAVYAGQPCPWEPSSEQTRGSPVQFVEAAPPDDGLRTIRFEAVDFSGGGTRRHDDEGR